MAANPLTIALPDISAPVSIRSSVWVVTTAFLAFAAAPSEETACRANLKAVDHVAGPGTTHWLLRAGNNLTEHVYAGQGGRGCWLKVWLKR